MTRLAGDAAYIVCAAVGTALLVGGFACWVVAGAIETRRRA